MTISATTVVVKIAVTTLGLAMLVGCTGAVQSEAPVEERSTGGATMAQPPIEGTGVALPAHEESTGEVQVRPMPQPSTVVTRRLPSTAERPAESAEVPAEPQSPAVLALVDSAAAQSRGGDHERAAASLERALQIEPANAALWHQLALVRLEQGELSQAVNLAARSNVLAADTPRLRADNWRLIAEVRTRQGNHEAAQAAEERALLLSNTGN